MIEFYCHPTCTTCKKAQKWLEKEEIPYRMINLKETPPSKETIQEAMSHSDRPIRQFFNTSGTRYRELGLKNQVPSLEAEEAAGLLASDDMLMKRPLAIKGGKVTVVFNEREYQTIWKKE